MAEKDPNPETGNLTMDKAGLESFLQNRVLPFKGEVRKIGQHDETFGPSMAEIIGGTKIPDSEAPRYGVARPLAIGFMLDSTFLEGKGVDLNEAVGKSAEDLIAIYEEQANLFKDIEENLRDTIDTLLSKQHENLVSVNGQDFLDIFEDVDEDLSGAGSSSDYGDDEE